MIPSPESPKAPAPRVCSFCGCREDNHPYRHRFDPVEFKRTEGATHSAPPAPIVKDSLTPAEPPVPVDLEAAFREGFHACDAGMGIEGAWEKSEAMRSRLSEAAPAAAQGGDTREALATLCHEQWSGWMRYLFGKCEILPNGDKGDLAVIPEWAVQRWKRQMETAYADLTDAEKESDRKEADRIIAVTLTQHGREGAK